MKLTAFKYGSTEITEKMAFQGGDINIKLPIALLFFLIEYENKKLLVDVGCDTMPGFVLSEFQKPVSVLEAYGVKRSEITDIIITHAHHDHIDALRYYPQADVFLHINELGNAQKYLHNNRKLHLVDKNKAFSDKIEFRFIGGHSHGSGIVLVKINDVNFVLCGDECYTKENLQQKKPTGSSYCLEKSVMFVEEYSKEYYVPVLFHDPELVSEIGFKTIADEEIS